MIDRIEELLLKVLRHWLPYYALAVALAATATGVALHYALRAFDNPETTNHRPDWNGGHATIDFGGQYLMGRMLVTGNGRELYNRRTQREVLTAVYPDSDQEPGKSDVKNLMYWTMGDQNDDPADRALGSVVTPFAAAGPLQAVAFLAAGQEEWTGEKLRNAVHPVGGPLYPPVNAFYNAPLALMTPRVAYRAQQLFNLALVWVAAAGAWYLARGRVWWPVLALCIMVFPGFAGSINLGQNATLTLTILVWGWALAARGRPVLGGMVWGLLAFKPVWALAFFLVPLLSRRWRMGLAMVGTGAVLCLLTLPFVGLHSWLDWLKIGKEAAELYDVEQNWIFLSRDLMSMPRRWVLDFGEGTGNSTRLDAVWWSRTVFGHEFVVPAWLPCLLIGWGLVLFALENTVRLAVLRRRQVAAADGPPAAFLFLGAWMCCFHFMYYDALLGALGLFLLFTEPRRFLEPLLVALAPLRNAVAGRATAGYHRPSAPAALPPPLLMDLGPRGVWVLNRMAPTAFALLVAINYLFPALGWGNHWGTPWDTYSLMAVWAWCGWQWLSHGEKVATTWEEGRPEDEVYTDVTLVAEADTEAEKNGEVMPAPDAPVAPSLPAAE